MPYGQTMTQLHGGATMLLMVCTTPFMRSTSLSIIKIGQELVGSVSG